MKSTTYGTGLKGKATRLHSEVVRMKGHCERCGKAGVPLDAAHIIGRRYAATRTDENNAWALCKGCHMRLTEHPHEHMELVYQTIGRTAFDELWRRANDGVKANDAFWQGEIDRLLALKRSAA